ncbi:hypothetical protein EXIGLDRAFT_38327 [Exidia glandulosa HHB12029]|uniref:Uncharacterized protein n=1 Tax=Exidia glandulosa HHB12029 TaxID=1314781 RepID=A0A166MTP2_EXIGL|nr:hypothetical protein EXIGLDRAFT_38327 [Exidia glandulosa HHB12029]
MHLPFAHDRETRRCGVARRRVIDSADASQSRRRARVEMLLLSLTTIGTEGQNSVYFSSRVTQVYVHVVPGTAPRLRLDRPTRATRTVSVAREEAIVGPSTSLFLRPHSTSYRGAADERVEVLLLSLPTLSDSGSLDGGEGMLSTARLPSDARSRCDENSRPTPGACLHARSVTCRTESAHVSRSLHQQPPPNV